MLHHARLAQSVERKTLNLVVVGSSPTVGVFAGSHKERLDQYQGKPDRIFSSDSLAERSKAPDSSSGGAIRVGSNPTAVIFASIPFPRLVSGYCCFVSCPGHA